MKALGLLLFAVAALPSLAIADTLAYFVKDDGFPTIERSGSRFENSGDILTLGGLLQGPPDTYKVSSSYTNGFTKPGDQSEWIDFYIFNYAVGPSPVYDSWDLTEYYVFRGNDNSCMFGCIALQNGVPQTVAEFVWSDGSIDDITVRWDVSSPEPGGFLLLLTTLSLIWVSRPPAVHGA